MEDDTHEAQPQAESNQEEEEVVNVNAGAETATSCSIETVSTAVELPFHKLIVGGTFSLGVLMLLGAALIMTLSLLDYSEFSDADVGDFESLGPEGCQILSTYSYEIFQKDLNSLNRLCVEEWEYNALARTSSDEVTFTSNPLTFEACKVGCNECPSSKLQGENYYAGVESNKRGQTIDNATFVECFQPTIPVNELSSFYECQETTCYQLKDPTIELKEKTESYEFGMLGAYVSIGVGCVLLLCSFWCMWKNRLARRKV